jgi:serine/threonine-protein kinase
VYLTETLQSLKAALADRYALERELGRGGMATVYLAHDLKHDRPVALKVLHPHLAASLGPERFLREIRLAARLQHPHILTVLDSGEAAGRLWFTMPYVEGESLRDRLNREKQLPVADAVRITTEAALALDFAHRHGVIHRDIKPENILLCDGQALVADFGVGRALGLPTPGDRLTETGTVVGTPPYMSPEQSTGEQSLDGRTDIYSLSVVLYEMLAAEVPFAGPTAQAILSRRLTEAPRPLHKVRETVPWTVEQAVLKALARAPADRFQTAADFAHALNAQTSERLPPVPTRESVWRSSRPRAIVAASVALALLVGMAVVAVRNRGGGSSQLDPTLVAVAPFDVLQPELTLWREGMVDLLSRNLDGAGPLRTVSPTLVVRRWQGRADRTSAGALAREAGAGVVVYGSLVGRGRDSVRLTASVLDVARGEVLGEAELRGTADGMDELTDSLTVRVLRDLARTRPIGAARASGLGSRSLPALRSFLRGEQFFRRTEWDSARTSYELAVALDTTFALAYWRLGTIRGWQFSVDDSLGDAFSQRAAALNHGLPPRESLLVVCDSLQSTLSAGEILDSAGRERHRRLFETAERVTSRYPTDPEAWVALGEARYHHGHGFGLTEEMMLEPFEKAVALDSSYAPAYIHPVTMAIRLNDYPAARRYGARYLALRPGGEHAISARLTGLLLDPATPETEIEHMLYTVPHAVSSNSWLDFMLAPDSREVAIRLARRLTQYRGITEEVWYRDPAQRQGMLVNSLAFRGHVREAANLVSAHSELASWPVFVELALLGVIPADTADAFYERRLERESFWSPGDPTHEGLTLGPVWWAHRGDSASLGRYLRRARSQSPPGLAANPYWVAVAEAYLALARRDTAQALSRFAALPDSLGPVWLDRLTLARLLAARGEDREALSVLDRGFPFPFATGSQGIWALERARLAEKMDETAMAKHWYGYVAALWRRADPELEPFVAEARVALGRLTSESGRGE